MLNIARQKGRYYYCLEATNPNENIMLYNILFYSVVGISGGSQMTCKIITKTDVIYISPAACGIFSTH